MKSFFKIITKIFAGIFFLLVILFVILGVLDEIIGPENLEKMLHNLGIPVKYDLYEVMLWFFVPILMTVIIYVLIKKSTAEASAAGAEKRRETA